MEYERNEKGQFVKGSGGHITPENAKKMQRKGAKVRSRNVSMKEQLFLDAGHKADGSDAPAVARNLVETFITNPTKWAYDALLAYTGNDGEKSDWSGKGECPTCGRESTLVDRLMSGDGLNEQSLGIAEEILDLLDRLEEAV